MGKVKYLFLVCVVAILCGYYFGISKLEIGGLVAFFCGLGLCIGCELKKRKKIQLTKQYKQLLFTFLGIGTLAILSSIYFENKMFILISVLLNMLLALIFFLKIFK